jgi:hypothetical protein
MMMEGKASGRPASNRRAGGRGTGAVRADSLSLVGSDQGN